MKRIIFLFITTIFITCKSEYRIDSVLPNQRFEGRGILYFRYPISGSTHQMIFIPTDKTITDLSDLSQKDYESGCYVWVSSRILLSEIYRNKKVVKPKNLENEVDPKQRIINFENVYIKLNVGSKNLDFPKSINDTIDLHRRKVVFTYFIPDDVVIDSLIAID